MKNRISSILVGMILVIGAASRSYAMSELVSLSVEPVWPTSTTPGTEVTYVLTTVARSGAGLLEVTMSVQGLPDGTTVTFSPDVIRFTGNQLTSQTVLMTVKCDKLIPTDAYPFVVTSQSQRETVTFTNSPIQSLATTGTQPVVLNLGTTPDSSFNFRGRGTPGQTYQLELTPSLSQPSWSPVGTTTADGNGRFTMNATKPAGWPMGFFRAIEPAKSVQ